MQNGDDWSETQDQSSSASDPGACDRRDTGRIGRYRVIRPLGQGGFGRVYLAHDDDLDRPVAVKVPSPGRIADERDVAAYLAEARALARLDHPHIVPVYDVGRTDDGLCFVVSKYIDGSDLSDRIARERPSPGEAAELAATVAEALHHAHTRGLVHRDIKPANILIDAAGAPWVADFGLALKDEDYGKGARLAGTPAYMSPEQARGEGHRVDGRSDIFSLGVVLYELLTGRKPFRGDTRSEIMDRIANADPRPPRQIDDALPRELERICLKALARRASERYSTGRDMAEDLRLYSRPDAAVIPSATPAASSGPTMIHSAATATTPVPAAEPSASAPISARSDSDNRPARIVPKGLRSFDRNDADFFLELLPGPRDRDGLPEGLRFWKSRIETTDPDTTFKVGLIYGPSGCGKSSMVKAGLIPRLGPDVDPAYVEASPEETEARLIRGLRKAVPDLDDRLDLVDAMAALRRGRVLPAGRKVLLVIDQFEQWLFARRAEAEPALVAALRQCDGEHVQAIVMVRDDFWMAATRLMRDLEIRIIEGENSAAVDLFDPMHARRVLSAFGRAYGVLPERSSDLNADQKAFLEQSVAGLSHEGKVISVRLALFAEMVKGRPWTTATLRDVGGARGVGAAFLEETFAAATAPPEHRLHQRAAQAVLRALLPDAGADIKGRMRTEDELREASGHAHRPRDFEDLIVILDRELRLITPTDPEGADVDGRRGYQLTHDYLVPSLREWLTRKQRETRRGRAELRLAERAAIWEVRPEGRHLPSLSEWLSIRALTRRGDWSGPQRAMMRRAGRVHGLRALATAAVAIGLGIAGWDLWDRVVSAGRARADASRARVRQLLDADILDVPRLLGELEPDRGAIEGELRRVVGDPLVNEKARLRAGLALLPVDPGQSGPLEQALLRAGAAEAAVLRDRLTSHSDALTPRLWPELESAGPGDVRILPVAAALALYDPDGPNWPARAGTIAAALVATERDALASWIELLRPVRRHLAAPLASIFREDPAPDPRHDRAAHCLERYASDDPPLLADLLMDAEAESYLRLFPVAAEHPEEVTAVLRAELSRRLTFSWDDSTPDPSWTRPDAKLVDAITAAGGIVADGFASCHRMAMADFLRTAEALRPSGYRPVRVRPYADGTSTQVAAVWTRDARPWRIASGLAAEGARRIDAKHREEKLIPVDVAGYIEAGADRYAMAWVAAEDGDDARMYVGATAEEVSTIRDDFEERGLAPRTLQLLLAPDGRMRSSGVWGRPAPGEAPTVAERDLSERGFAAIRARRGDAVFRDLSIAAAEGGRPIAERDRIALEQAGKVLAADPEDTEARRARALAALRLGETAKALDDLIALGDDDLDGLRYRAIARARLGREPEARADLEAVENAYAPDHFKRSVAAVVAAELGEDTGPSLKVLDAAIAREPEDIDLLRDAARAFALASKPIAARDPEAGRRLADRAVEILGAISRIVDVDTGPIDDDVAFDAIREHPGFLAILERFHIDRRHAAVWSLRENRECRIIAECDPDEHLRLARALADEGFRPVAWTVARESTTLSASAWQRPMIPDAERDRLARRQARAAVALIRMGRGDAVWPLLRHGPDPRVRSFLIDAMAPLGVSWKAIADELARLDPDGRGSPPSSESTGAILFDREVSIRRALIQALGRHDAGTIPDGEREAMAGKLLASYRRDSDAGIRGAAAWTLRRWGMADRLAAVDAEPKSTARPGGRRWFVNGEGQTFAVVDGPREFLMGSPPTDTERARSIEPPRRVAIPRRYAIAATEVTIAQFERFARTHRRYQLDAGLKQLTAGPDGPRIGVNWYAAAAYCNWLSEREGLGRDQWCYLPGPGGSYADGMTIPADAPDRAGYRLPTEAEWEYACRAGAATGRYHGSSIELLGARAWYGENSDNRCQPCGRLLPNDLGLFDMLGNVYEWCHDRDAARRPGRGPVVIDAGGIVEIVRDNRMRMFRGGSYAGSPDEVRSSARSGELPTYLGYLNGFRLARTIKGP